MFIYASANCLKKHCACFRKPLWILQ